jgi:hypothetical protein
MVPQRQIRGINTDSNFVSEEEAFEQPSRIEDSPQHLDKLTSVLCEHTDNILKDRALPPPPYEENEPASDMTRESLATSTSRRNSRSLDSRNLTLSNARYRDINNSSSASASRVYAS